MAATKRIIGSVMAAELADLIERAYFCCFSATSARKDARGQGR